MKLNQLYTLLGVGAVAFTGLCIWVGKELLVTK